LLGWSGQGETAEVPDPYSGSFEEFQAVYRLLDRATDAILTKLQLPA
jgi:protein-tyrosine-phosphatase